MSELGEGTSHSIQHTIETLGANVIQIDPSDAVKAGVSSGAGGKSTLTPADCEAIIRECTAARWAAPSVDMHAQILHSSRNWSPRNVLGTTPEYLHIKRWDDFAEGTSFTEDDVKLTACVCLIGHTPARELFGSESPLGQEVRVNNVSLRVVGVLPTRACDDRPGSG